MTLNDPNAGFKVTLLSKGEYFTINKTQLCSCRNNFWVESI